MRNVALLGSTGSIGTATLDVISKHTDKLQLASMAAGYNKELFLEQCECFKPKIVSLAKLEDAHWLSKHLSYRADIMHGAEGLMCCTQQSASDTLVVALSGLSGLTSLEAALMDGKRVCVANKESLVVGGNFIRQALCLGKGELLPIDSEHCALHQLLNDKDYSSIQEIRLTASGGPFLNWDIDRIKYASINEALRHPTWKMGPKITIDSATLMNKGLEVIEASVLFGFDSNQISVTIHPQSQVHAIIGFKDGTYQAQFCVNDMRVPIQYALLYPERLNNNIYSYDWNSIQTWTFHAPDLIKFPCLSLAYQALRIGGSAPIIMNGANDEAVYAFLNGKIKFYQIYACIESTMSSCSKSNISDIHSALEVDYNARLLARNWINKNY